MSLVLACWTPKKGYMLGDRACVDEDRVWKGINPKVYRIGKALVGAVGDYAAAMLLGGYQVSNVESAVEVLLDVRSAFDADSDVEVLACGPDGLFLMGADGVIAEIGELVYGIGAGGDMAFGHCMSRGQTYFYKNQMEHAALFTAKHLISVRPPFDILEVEW